MKPWCKFTTVDTGKDKPYRMQPVLQLFLSRLPSDKFLYSIQFVFTARLKSAGVVENIACMVREDEFVIDIVVSTLQAGFSLTAIANDDELAEPLLWSRVQTGQVMRSKYNQELEHTRWRVPPGSSL